MQDEWKYRSQDNVRKKHAKNMENTYIVQKNRNNSQFLKN